MMLLKRNASVCSANNLLFEEIVDFLTTKMSKPLLLKTFALACLQLVLVEREENFANFVRSLQQSKEVKGVPPAPFLDVLLLLLFSVDWVDVLINKSTLKTQDFPLAV
jgi:hypothetical protein